MLPYSRGQPADAKTGLSAAQQGLLARRTLVCERADAWSNLHCCDLLCSDVYLLQSFGPCRQKISWSPANEERQNVRQVTQICVGLFESPD